MKAESGDYLVFSLQGLRYALDIAVVMEIARLPELTPIAESPDFIAGAFNYRGHIIPVLDLDIRLGFTSQRYSVSDKVVLVEDGKKEMLGIIVNEVLTLKNIPLEEIETAPYHEMEELAHPHFLAGLIKAGEEIIMLLDHIKLLKHAEPPEEIKGPDSTDSALSDSEEREEIDRVKHPVFCPEATEEERRIFRSRAKELRHSPEFDELTGLHPIAVFDLKGELYGIDLSAVRELTMINNMASIPCCPDYIHGILNLRGEIITVLDIGPFLNIPVSVLGSESMAIIVQSGGITAGVHCDKVVDALYISESDITGMPSALHSEKDEYLTGLVPYGDRMASIIDINRILEGGALIVNEGA